LRYPQLLLRRSLHSWPKIVRLALAALLISPVTLHAQQQSNSTPPRTSTTQSELASAQDDTEVDTLTKQLASVVAEAGSTTASASTNDSGPLGIVPLKHGFNASLGSTSQHDSSNGWSSIITPNVAYRFSPHWSGNVGLPIYAHIEIDTAKDVVNKAGDVTSQAYVFKARSFLFGDTDISAEFEAHPRLFDYNVTTSLGTPTGDYPNGLGAGQVTYAINNHFEHPIGDWFTPELELGIGDSSNLIDSRVRQSYTVIGENAHFQFGFGFSLPLDINFTTDAYEDLPLSSQTVTSSTTNGKKGKQEKTIITTSQESFGEDNGFLNTLDIPLNGHVTLSGFYNRSLRNKIDTAGFSLTFLLRSAPHGHQSVH
jgi:hypothetical protein